MIDYPSLETQARRKENQNDWYGAANLWKLAGRMDDYDACIMIAESNAIGDKFRATVEREAGEEPNKCESPHAWVRWYDKMTSIYNRIFKS